MNNRPRSAFKKKQNPAAATRFQRQGQHLEKKVSRSFQNLIYQDQYLNAATKKRFVDYLQSLYPIWENRFSEHNPPPEGAEQRRLLRPVYWLGNWQFACLNYYHPPKGILHRCLRAEPFPDFMQEIVNDIENQVRSTFLEKDVPRNWKLNTCLVNYYGDQVPTNSKRLDVARVGEHKDFEPGPVASISFGERALFQFVRSEGKNARSEVVLQQWLDDNSLQIFGGDKYKKFLFHRVQRVDDKKQTRYNCHKPDFETRRLNLTFRYVPEEHIYPLNEMPLEKRQDIDCYLQDLAQHSPYFKKLLADYPV